WLECAYRLAGPAAEDRLRRGLVLAAWYKKDRDAKLAGKVVPERLHKKTLDRLLPQEPVRFALVPAATRPPDPQRGKAAVKSYAAALDKLRGLLHEQSGPDANEEFRDNVVHPLCEMFHTDVIRLLLDKERRQAFLAPKDEELENGLARLSAATAEVV